MTNEIDTDLPRKKKAITKEHMAKLQIAKPLQRKARAGDKIKKVSKKDSLALRKKTWEVENKTKEFKKSTIVDTDVLNYGSAEVVDALKDKKVIWQPFDGVQTEFLASDEDEVLYAGGRGSGKSACLVVDPLRYCTNKNFRALIIRRTMPELLELISRAKEIYYQAFPGTEWKQQDKVFKFPSGATIWFGYCDTVDDAERYRGQQYTWLGIDELTQYETPEIYNKLKGSLRTTDSNLKVYVRATSNPTGRGRWWVKEYFIDKAESGVRFADVYDTPLGKMTITKKWFQSTVMDNPIILKNNPQYLATLASLPEALRKQWLEGSWDAVDGLAFPEFDTNRHVIDPFKIPNQWLRIRGCDWGFSSLAVCLWLAIDYDNNVYVYREFATNGPIQPRFTADLFAKEILEREKLETIRYGVLDASTWAHRGDSGPSIAEEMILNGAVFRPSDRSDGSRKAAVMTMHRLLRPDEVTGKPKIQIFNNCKELIKCLQSIPIDSNDPEDVDTKANDHAWDALMYAIMSRYNLATGYDDWVNQSLNKKPVIINNTFGY